MPDKSITDLENELTSQFPDNISGQITPAIVRQMIKDILENEHPRADQIATASGTPSSSTVLYGDNTWRAPPAGGGTFNGTGDPGLTWAQIASTTFASPPVAMRLSGYFTPGDGGGGLVVKIVTPPTDHSAWTTSVDGSHYVLVPELGQVSLLQFGAKPMADYNVMPAIGGDQDAYAAFVAADKFIAQAYGAGVKLIVPSSTGGTGPIWFLGRTHSLYRCNYIIEGFSEGKTFIRTPPYSSGMVVGGQFGPLENYSLAGNGNAVVLGTRYLKQDFQAGPGNLYICVTPGTTDGTDPLGATEINTASTYTWGTSQWKFIANVGPGTVWDYSVSANPSMNMIFRGLSFWSFWVGGTLPTEGGPFVNTDPATNKFPDQDLDMVGLPQYRCGILLRSRSTIEHCQFLAYNGFGLAAAGNGDPELPFATGNVDGVDVNHIQSYYNGKAGLHVFGQIANAGSFRYIDTHANGRMGIEDFSFLGNNYDSIQSSTDGLVFSSSKEYLSGCTYNGYLWYPRIYLKGVETSPTYDGEEPGSTIAWTRYGGDGTLGVRGTLTGSISGTVLTVTATTMTSISVGDMISSIYLGGADAPVRPGTRILSFRTGTGGTGTYNLTGASQTVPSTTITVMDYSYYLSDQFQPWYGPGFKYEWGGSFGTQNVNARNRWGGTYQEGGVNPSQPGPKDLVIGGLNGLIDFSRGGAILQNTTWNEVVSPVFRFATNNCRIFSMNGNPPSVAGSQYAPFKHGDIWMTSANGAGGIWGWMNIQEGGDPGNWRSLGTMS